MLRLARLFRAGRIDVVHTHDERPHIYGAFAARLAGVRRLIHTRHHGMADRLTRRQAGLVRLASRADRPLRVRLRRQRPPGRAPGRLRRARCASSTTAST